MNSLVAILKNRAYFSVAYVFATLNILYGTWAIYIPIIKEQLSLSKAELGIALFAFALGIFSIMGFVPKIINSLGSGKATKISILMLPLLYILPFVSNSLSGLIISLFLMGVVQGVLDISMNNLVTIIEKRDQVNLMSAMHGFFSLGGAFAGLGTFLIIQLNNAVLHIGIAAFISILLNYLLSKEYSFISGEQESKEKVDWSYLKTIFLLGLISFVIMGSEGAIADWSGLYLKDITLAPTVLFGAGFLGFSITMTIGRFLGDGISEKLGSRWVLLAGAFIASLGYLLVLVNELYISIGGFGLIGLGFSVMVPELFRITGKTSKIDAAKALTIVAGCGYSGFLIGPVVLGFTAERFGLEYSFYGLLSSCIFVLIICSYLLINNTKTK
jgi:fucose permease